MNKEPDRNPRKALGKGLSALLPSRPVVIPRSPEDVASSQSPAPKSAFPENFDDFQAIPLHLIEAGPNQPRDAFDPDKLAELAQSIKMNGLIQPITVEKQPGGKYRIIAGERRWRASQSAGLETIPALVRTIQQENSLELALIENIQREDLNPIEIAQAFHRLHAEHGLSHEQIADRTGKDRSTVTNLLRLLKLGEATRTELRNGTLTVGHARALLNIQSEEAQDQICREIIARRFSVRETEAYVKKLTQRAAREDPLPPAEEKKLDPNIRAALDEMAMALGTKVNLTPRKLEIEYYSAEDLERIYAVIVRQ